LAIVSVGSGAVRLLLVFVLLQASAFVVRKVLRFALSVLLFFSLRFCLVVYFAWFCGALLPVWFVSLGAPSVFCRGGHNTRAVLQPLYIHSVQSLRFLCHSFYCLGVWSPFLWCVSVKSVSTIHAREVVPWWWIFPACFSIWHFFFCCIRLLPLGCAFCCVFSSFFPSNFSVFQIIFADLERQPSFSTILFFSPAVRTLFLFSSWGRVRSWCILCRQCFFPFACVVATRGCMVLTASRRLYSFSTVIAFP
jgi:hypothetical protein